jgi:hypothetical protein
MKNRYHYKLQLPIEFVPMQLDFTISSHQRYDVSNVNKELRDFLNTLGVEIFGVEVFFRNINDTGGIHIDGSSVSNFTKINYVYGEGNMNWFNLKPNKELILGNTINNTPYLLARNEDCEKVWSANIDQSGSLVNVGDLHSVSDITGPRICYCLMLEDMSTKHALQWDQALELFKGYYI